MSGKESLKAKLEKKPVLYLGLMLFLFCMFAGLLLGVVYENTKDTIAAKKDAVSRAAFESVLPEGASELIPMEVPEIFNFVISECYEAPGYGYALKVIGNGYKGDPIEMALGINSVGIISGVQIITHSETAGLGANAAKPAFLNQFIGLNALEPIGCVKGDPGDNEIDAITGATKTSDGIVSAINTACEYYRYFLREEAGDND